MTPVFLQVCSKLVSAAYLRRYLPLGLAIVLGLVVSLCAFRFVRAWEEARSQAEFEEHVAASARLLGEDLQNVADLTYSLAAFYDASKEVERDEFATFTKPLLLKYPEVESLEWAPRVPAPARSTIEQYAQRQGHRDFEITEQGGAGGSVRAALRPEYFPVLWVESTAGHEHAPGFDLSSEPACRAALDRTLEAGQAAATARATKAHLIDGEPGVRVVLPVYGYGTPPDFKRQPGELSGVVVAAFHIGNLVEHCLANLTAEGINFRLFEDDAPNRRRLLYAGDAEGPSAHPSEQVSHPIRASARSIVWCDQSEVSWLLDCTPGPGYRATVGTWPAWTVLAGGVLLTAGLNACLLRAMTRRQRVEQLVVRRTAELSAANSGLLNEVVERKRAEDALLESKTEVERSLRKLEAFNRAMVGREARVIEMKQEVNALAAELGREPTYAQDYSAEVASGQADAVPRSEPAREPVPITDYPIADNPHLEKRELDIAYIPILCSAPLLYAASHGHFAANGLKINLILASGWSGVKDLMTYGQVDAAHMLAPMTLACGLGIDGRRSDICLAAIQNVNGQALTLAMRHAGIRDVREMKGFTFCVPYRFSMHYYLLCDYLAKHGLNPLTDVTIKEVAPPRMPYYLQRGWADGAFGPEPFNQISVHRGLGFIYALSKSIWAGHPCCSIAVSRDFIDRNPNTYRAMLKSVLQAELALHRAGPDERRRIAAAISAPGFLNQPDSEPVAQALAGEYPDGRGNHHVDHDRIDFIPHVWSDYGRWMLTQMQRWNQLRRPVDYREVVAGSMMEHTGDFAEALGYEKRTRPQPRADDPCQASDPLEAMRTQPFSSFREETAQASYAPAASVEERLNSLLQWAARFSGGKAVGELPDLGNDAVGQLAGVLGDIHTNMRYAALALEEQVHRQEELVAERTTAMERSRQAALSLMEDAHDARTVAEETNQKLAEQTARANDMMARAEAANRSKSEFLANMSHEIRTPMTAILGFSDVLLESGDLENAPPERIEAAETIKQNGVHLLHLIDDILDLSKIESGRMNTERIACSPRQLVAEVMSLVRVRAHAKGLSLEIEYAGPVPETIQTDPTRLRQILINLLGNAIKFTNVGEVRLVARFVADERGAIMQFDVVDSGIGMTAEQVVRLFQPFAQADASTTRKFGGTGLGLAISKRLAGLLGGDLTVVETQPGAGTRMRVTVATGPLHGVRMVEGAWNEEAAALQREAASVSTSPTIKAKALDGMRILLAEDNSTNQVLICGILKKAGAEVTAVENGKLAAEKVLAAMCRRRDGDLDWPFDVILMDMQMPEMDGYEATGLLREKGYTGPIIALTAHAMASDRQKCLDAGCDDYASKPINRTALLATIRAHLRSPVLSPS